MAVDLLGAPPGAPSSELLEAAVAYLPRTIPLVGKSPQRAVGRGWPRWQATRASVTAYFTANPDANVGIRTGNGLGGLDVDYWDGGDVALAELEAEHGGLPATPTVITGSGSRHYYFRAPRWLRSRNLRSIGIAGIEIAADGRQLVAPPSTHPDSGRVYCWHPDHPLIEAEFAEMPAWLVDLAGATQPRARRASKTDDPLLSLSARDYVPALLGVELGRAHKVLCPFHPEVEPSLHCYAGDRGWYCYGCGRGGSIIDLGALILGIAPRGAGYWRIRERLESYLGASS